MTGFVVQGHIFHYFALPEYFYQDTVIVYNNTLHFFL